MQKQCYFRYPTSSCMGPVVKTSYGVSYATGNISTYYECANHHTSGFNTEEEARQALVTQRLEEKNYEY